MILPLTNGPRGYDVWLTCKCGKRFASLGDGKLHSCPACGEVYNLMPGMETFPKVKGIAHQPKKARNRKGRR